MQKIGEVRIKKLFQYVIALSLLTFAFSQDQIVTLKNNKKVILYSDKTWDYYKENLYDYDFSSIKDNEIPDFLRSGIKVNKKILTTAVEMYLQGWRYTMPKPKSNQASWGNSDGRTTWWYGYWYNTSTKKYSTSKPEKQSNGLYFGNDQNKKGSYRNGGSPRYPSKIDWLLSTSGGVKPY